MCMRVCANYTELNVGQKDVKKIRQRGIRNVHSSPAATVGKLGRTELERAQLSPKIRRVHTNQLRK